MKNRLFKYIYLQKFYAFSLMLLTLNLLIFSNREIPAQKSENPPVTNLSSRSFTTISAIPLEIPDGDANGTNFLFNVSGINGIVNHVEISFGFNPAHTWSGDIKAVLTSPNNASHTLVDRVGETIVGGAGDSSDLAGPYTFSDQGGDLWQSATSVGSEAVIPAGFYRTTSGGSADFTNMDPIFAGHSLNLNNNGFQGLEAQLANGTWRLNVSDNGEGDTGTVNFAELTITYSLATAANVSLGGRVMTERGVIRNATVMLIGGNLTEPLYAKTNDFGAYNFTELAPNQIYVVSVISKKYRFSQPNIVMELQNDVSDVNFVADE
ncbi:MAG: carboxypeptidase-like regulatory domain-containing protein [Pyrinomonadaceae bacterium]|nr:carboxypeptidase-like regulatory domain-containing protein [Pyrinomonadaceae bacterium]